jgi:hypothetical protein
VELLTPPIAGAAVGSGPLKRVQGEFIFTFISFLLESFQGKADKYLVFDRQVTGVKAGCSL